MVPWAARSGAWAGSPVACGAWSAGCQGCPGCPASSAEARAAWVRREAARGECRSWARPVRPPCPLDYQSGPQGRQPGLRRRRVADLGRGRCGRDAVLGRGRVPTVGRRPPGLGSRGRRLCRGSAAAPEWGRPPARGSGRPQGPGLVGREGWKPGGPGPRRPPWRGQRRPAQPGERRAARRGKRRAVQRGERRTPRLGLRQRP